MTLVNQFVTNILIVMPYYEFVTIVNVRFSCHISKKLIRNMHRSSWVEVFQRKSISKSMPEMT